MIYRFVKRQGINDWLVHFGVQSFNIHDDLTVDVEGDVNLSFGALGNLQEFPFKFGVVTGNFDCGNNKLVSLSGCPRVVGGDFCCNENELQDLIGSPTTVSGSFFAHNNKLVSLRGAPFSVGGAFYVANNRLKNIIGCPQFVGGGFNCYGNTDLGVLEDMTDFKSIYSFANMEKLPPKELDAGVISWAL